jgi:hypothetical protein
MNSQLIAPSRWSATDDGAEWDRFVDQHGGSIFHSWAWRTVLSNDNLRPHYAICRGGNGNIIAALPLIAAEGRRFMHLQTPPDSFTAGPVVKADEADPGSLFGTLSRLPRFSFLKPVEAIHILTHQQSVAEPLVRSGFQHKLDEYGLLMVDLYSNSLEDIWGNGFRKHDRQTVKYHEDIGCDFRLGSRAEDLEGYLALKEGPVWNRFERPEFIQSMKQNLGDNLKMGVVTQDGRVIAGSLFLCDRGTSTAHLMSMRYSLMKNIHSPVTFMNWMTTKWISEQKFRFVNFGPWSKEHVDDSAHSGFKLMRRFGANFIPRHAFTIRPSGVAYSIARGFGKVMRRMK